MKSAFSSFLANFQPVQTFAVDVLSLATEIENRFGVQVPDSLKDFWKEIGCGVFAEGELTFLGDQDTPEREGVVQWNDHPFWREVFVPPAEGGPVFFAETCVGDQIGFRWKGNGTCIPVLFTFSSFELFVMGDSFDKLFIEVMTERYAVLDPEQLAAARTGVGPVLPGYWYCPIISPLVGGSTAHGNFMKMTPKAFASAAIAEWVALGRPEASH